MTYTALQFEKKDHIAIITLNRPDSANALNIDLARDLMQVSLECDEDADIRAAVMTGNGRMFCAGGDLKSFAAQGDATARPYEGSDHLSARRGVAFCPDGRSVDRSGERHGRGSGHEYCLFV